MANIEEKYQSSPRLLDLESICLDARFGDLQFLNSVNFLEKMKEDIVELEDFDYRQYLTTSEINNIESARNQFNDLIKQISDFTISQPNPLDVRNNIQNSVVNFYQSSFASLTRSSLIYLRQQFKLDNKTEKELQQTIISAKKLETELQSKLEKIKEDQASVIKGSGIVSSKYLSKVFKEQANKSEGKILLWSNLILGLSIGLLILVIGLFFIYFFFIRNLNDKGAITEFAVFSTLGVATIFYYLRFSIRNYNVLNHLTQSNSHRANVAETLENYISASNNDQEVKLALLKEAACAMFQSDSTGYLNKDQIEASSPVKEMINTIISDKKI